MQRTMLELLNQLDGFEATKNIKVKLFLQISADSFADPYNFDMDPKIKNLIRFFFLSD